MIEAALTSGPPDRRLQVVTEEDWYPVGDMADTSRFRRWPHHRRIRPFAVRGGASLAVGLDDIAALAADGRYDKAVERLGRTGLRPGDALMRLPGPVPLLRHGEAAILCLLLGGRLPEEEEVERILATQALITAPVAVWTDTPWSCWSYTLTGYDPSCDRWLALPDRILPDRGGAAGLVTLFRMAPTIRREPGRREPDRREPGLTTPGAGTSDVDVAAAWLILPP